MSYVTTTTQDGVATIQWSDPRRHNALSHELLDGVLAAFRGFGPDVRAVVLRAAPGDRTWSGGYNVKELGRGRDPLEPTGLLAQTFAALADCPAPVIGMLHGAAYGGGCDLALRCDLLVGDPTAALAFTPARLGVPYDLDGIANLMLRAGPQITMEMFATAAPMPAERLAALGVMNRLVSEDALEAETYALARGIAANAPLSVACCKLHVRKLAAAFAAALRDDPALAAARAAAVVSNDYEEGLAALRERRAPHFQGN